jgi:hypothetical protein
MSFQLPSTHDRTIAIQKRERHSTGESVNELKGWESWNEAYRTDFSLLEDN